MTKERALYLLKRTKPKNLDDVLESTGLSLQYIDQGAFRKVYSILGTGLVIKIPIESARGRGLEHALNESQVLKRLNRLKKYAPIKSLMPKMLYFDKITGICVMPRYKKASRYRHGRAMDEISEMFTKITGKWDCDISRSKEDNYGLDSNGCLVILDLGCMPDNL